MTSGDDQSPKTEVLSAKTGLQAFAEAQGIPRRDVSIAMTLLEEQLTLCAKLGVPLQAAGIALAVYAAGALAMAFEEPQRTEFAEAFITAFREEFTNDVAANDRQRKAAEAMRAQLESMFQKPAEVTH